MNDGFFTKKEVESKSRPSGKINSCASCGLYKHVKFPKMAPYGEFRKEIMIVGEAPGEYEDLNGKPWQGKAGKLLQLTLESLGIDLFKDCLSINACRCRPIDTKGGNRIPTNFEIECCRPTTLQIVEQYNPKVILLLGNAAIYSFLGHRWRKNLEGVYKWRGFTIPDQDFTAWLCPTFHPSFINRLEKNVEIIWKQDLMNAISLTSELLPKNKPPIIKIITDLKELYDIKSDLISFDYETTGLKPQAKGHRIICASVSPDENSAYVFLMPKSQHERKPFIELLSNNLVGKMAHNCKFEDTWSRVRLQQTVRNWQWDSMLAAHLLDNRKGITGLKFQTYVNFGIVDYDSEISPYLQADDKNGNSFNKINKLISNPEGVHKLLYYCALDSIYEYRLAMKQIKIIDYNFLPF